MSEKEVFEPMRKKAQNYFKTINEGLMKFSDKKLEEHILDLQVVQISVNRSLIEMNKKLELLKA